MIGNRVFIAGGFTSIANNKSNNTTSYNQRFLASYNLDTGLVDTAFRPTFDAGVTEIEASPDGTRLYVVGRFNTVNGATKRKLAAINPTNGSTITGFTAHLNGPVPRSKRPTPPSTSVASTRWSTARPAPAWRRSTPPPAP